MGLEAHQYGPYKEWAAGMVRSRERKEAEICYMVFCFEAENTVNIGAE